MVPEPRLAEIVKSSVGSLERLVRQLIEAANQNGGKDNVTALALRYLR
jgi:serine/threonine protein phosphatase PrpC